MTPAGAWRPPVLPAYAGMEPPPGYRTESVLNRGLLWGGALTLGIGYGTALSYGLARSFDDGLGVLALPILGPWLAMSRLEFTCNSPQTVDEARACQNDALDDAKQLAVLGTVGLVQAVGGTLLFVGLFDRRERWVREDVGVSSLRLDAIPLPGGGVAQLGGRF